MFVDWFKRMAHKLLGDNVMLKNIVRREFRKGNRIKAGLLVLYTLPFRKTLRFSSPFVNYSFAISPDYYDELQDLLHISKAEGPELIRVGRKHDGGYIMLRDLRNRGGGIAYSFGLGYDVSWDKDMASRGYDVFMYDHTIDKLPDNDPRFHFFRKGLAGGTEHDDNLDTLDNFIKANHHEGKHDMILKMDVEGYEWDFLLSASPETLSRFSQIVFEFHGINEPGRTEKILKALHNLNRTHQLIHLHTLNIGYCVTRGGKIFGNQIEAAYALKSKYNFIHDYDVILPLDIDTPTNPDLPDIQPGEWNRKADMSDNAGCVTGMLHW